MYDPSFRQAPVEEEEESGHQEKEGEEIRQARKERRFDEGEKERGSLPLLGLEPSTIGSEKNRSEEIGGPRRRAQDRLIAREHSR